MATKKLPQKKAAPKLPSITAKIDRLIPTEGDGVRAIASVNIGGAYAAHGFKVYESEEKGLSVLNPSSKYQKDGKNQYSDVIHAVTPEARTAINDAILEAYEQKLQEEQGEDLDENMDEDIAQGQTM